MRIVIDTNIIIDYLEEREPFSEHAARILELCEDGSVEGLLTANAITDIYYIVRKIAGREKTSIALRTLCSFLGVAEISRADILGAFDLPIPDFEDALVAQCAKKVKADYIVTRNMPDFAKSQVLAIEPADFLNLLD